MEFIPYGKQNIIKEDIEAVVETLQSDWLTQGPTIKLFEEEIANYCQAKYAVALCNGTAALHLSCLALGLGNEDYLWTSPNTFTASANCALYCGAKVDFVDINPCSYNMDVNELERKLIECNSKNQLPKIVIPVHFAGQPSEMQVIQKLSIKYGFAVVEDACHAIGSRYKGSKIGSCSYSDLTVFSFHPVKTMTTGEGGIITTNSYELYQKLIRLRSHGITRDESQMEGESHGSWYYQQIELGYNYRISDIQAALGRSQLKRLDLFIKKRKELVEYYNLKLKDLPVVIPWQHKDTESTLHLYVIKLKLDEIKITHKEVFESLRSRGIGVNLHYIPVHTQPYYKNLGFQPGDYPEAEKYYNEAISLPLYYDLTTRMQDSIIKTLSEIILS